MGTAAARPTVGRNVSGIAIQREGSLILLDCGEGTQRQMMRFASGFSISHIFISHTHADHILGITGLLRTMGLQGREEPLLIFGPKGSGRVLRAAVNLGFDRTPFDVEIEELPEGETVAFDGWAMVPFPVQHGLPTYGYALIEEARLGRFDVEKAIALGVPEGPLFGKLHRGESIEVEGRLIRPQDLVGPPRKGRRVVYSADTRPCDATREISKGAELLIHEATFCGDELERARETRHSTVTEAAQVALDAGVKQLVLTHISARYADSVKVLEVEARKLFANSRVAFDGMCIEIPYSDE